MDSRDASASKNANTNCIKIDTETFIIRDDCIIEQKKAGKENFSCWASGEDLDTPPISGFPLWSVDLCRPPTHPILILCLHVANTLLIFCLILRLYSDYTLFMFCTLLYTDFTLL